MRRSAVSRNPYLPMTEDDIVRRLLHQKTKRLMKKRKKLGRLGRLPIWLILLILVGLLMVTIHFVTRHRKSKTSPSAPRKVSPASPPEHSEVEKPSSSRRALQQFPSLQYALSHSRLVALYFAASWCPMSTPVSHLLDEQFGSILVPPQGSHNSDEKSVRHGSLSLVYVSSDRSEEEMQSYVKDRPFWMLVPYDSPDRSLLKKHFKTCAQVELDELQLDRKHEIPTLIVVDSESHQVLTFTGVKDVQESGAKALDTWFELARLSAALDAKFHHGDDAALVA